MGRRTQEYGYVYMDHPGGGGSNSTEVAGGERNLAWDTAIRNEGPGWRGNWGITRCYLEGWLPFTMVVLFVEEPNLEAPCPDSGIPCHSLTEALTNSRTNMRL